MGQNIGTCVTAILASFGTNKNAKRASLVHLSFNVIGTVVWLTVFTVVNAIFAPALFGETATLTGIATAHSLFNLACTLLLLPMSGLLEKLALKLIPDAKQPEKISELDERLLLTPAIALERSHALTLDMARVSADSLKSSIECLRKYESAKATAILEAEEKTDHYEDIIGNYLVKLSSQPLNEKEGMEASMLLKAIGDLERVSDQAVNILKSAEELREKGIVFSDEATKEMESLCDATLEIVSLALIAFTENNLNVANCVEPLEEVIDKMKEFLRAQHIERLRRGNCSIEAGFVWSDLITNMERVSDHCSNIAGCIVDAAENTLSLHESLSRIRGESAFYKEKYAEYSARYLRFN